MPDHTLPDTWEFMTDGKSVVDTATDENGLTYLLDIRPRDSLIGTSGNGIYAERTDTNTYTVAMLDGRSDFPLLHDNINGHIFEYETETEEPDQLYQEIVQAYRAALKQETQAVIDSLILNPGVTPTPPVDPSYFSATQKEDLEDLYDEAFDSQSDT